MLGYVTVGSNDLPRATAYYAALLAGLGITKMFDHSSGGAIFGKAGKLQFGVLGPYDGKPATVGNGMMVAFEAESRGAVDVVHAHALALGGSSEGDPGVRGPDPEGPFYGAYFRDLDGNKLCVYNWRG